MKSCLIVFFGGTNNIDLLAQDPVFSYHMILSSTIVKNHEISVATIIGGPELYMKSLKTQYTVLDGTVEMALHQAVEALILLHPQMKYTINCHYIVKEIA